MNRKKKTSPLFYVLIILVFIRVISSLAITNFYRDLYSLAFTITYFVIFIGSLLRKKAAYILATVIALFDIVLGLTMTQGTIFSGALFMDTLILLSSIILIRQDN